ncbi:hypothetical protein [Pelomonas sp. KK5]|uniref:hypothetical protein n=1 Tax=Pelomonas sp. KK5 TaxID=1855730 RepID=UPI0009F8D2DB|nr:hypothetical protein [Pelomonas sp. KK5]
MNKTMNKMMLRGLLLLCAAPLVHAAGPLYLDGNPVHPKPLRWDTSQGPVKVYTDVGDFSRRNDGTTFLSETQANAITAFALKQWSSVPTSTWRAETDPAKFTRFTDVPSIGQDVHDAATAALVYGHYNQGGFYVIYDVDGSILQDYFGLPRDQILGMAMPEIAEDRDGDGYAETIVKATAIMNGWMVVHETPPPGQRALPPADTDGSRYASIFTHEFGHALNLSHSQVNGQLAFLSWPDYDRSLYPGVKGCVAPVHHWLDGPAATKIDPKYVETMFPYADPQNVARGRSIGVEMSTVDRPDDIAAISNLYPTADYASRTGTIAGTLVLKDGRTGYSGINIIARNVADPLGDAVSAISGDQTQGLLGPDGSFRINNLKPGASYVLYLEEITAGGYPTTPTMLISQAEYWNAGESSNPDADTPCMQTAITAEAGVVKTASFVFNGHADGVQYSFLTSGYLTSLSTDGRRAGGMVGEGVPLIWDALAGVAVPPTELELMASGNGTISRDGRQLLVQANFDGRINTDPYGGPDYKLKQMALWNLETGALKALGALSDHCGLDGNGGSTSSYGWGLNADATAAVGGAVNQNPDGSCVQMDYNTGQGLENAPYLWTQDAGGRALSMLGVDLSWTPWVRAAAVGGSGDSLVVVGHASYSQAFAWTKQSAKPIALTPLTGATSAEVINADATRVPLATPTGMLLWNPQLGTIAKAFQNASSPKYCIDFPFSSWDGVDYCSTQGPAWVEANYGVPGLSISSISDDGRVVLARVGSFFTSFAGFMWVEDAGWIKLNDFFRRQGVVEAALYGMDNPLAVAGNGTALVGGLTGVPMTWYVDMKKAFVCRAGASTEVDFPAGFAAAVKAGAQAGRCENL